MADELTWDYTGDESSPLLQRAASPFYRWACFVFVPGQVVACMLKCAGEYGLHCGL